ncbi:replication protein A 70 kDa DNA-binding subunit B [Tanacetum coccineum]
MWDEYSQKRNDLGHVVFILQPGKVKYWDGTPSIHNALFGTKIFKELPEYDESQYKIELFTPQKPVVTIAEFFHGAVKKMVPSIRECEQKSHCIVYARIHKIHRENRWAYTACKECNKKVSVVESKASSSYGKNKVTFYCEDHGAVQVASRYKVIMRIIDQSGSAPIVFFNTMINKLSSSTAWELMERHGMDVDEYWPEELLNLVGKRFASGLNCVLQMTTPSPGIEASGSGSGSGSKRAFIDLDDIESEEDEGEGGTSSQTQRLVRVKVEKEDP